MKRKHYWLLVTIFYLVLIWPAHGAASRPTPCPIACGSYHSLAIKADRTLWAWGDNANVQLGIGYAPPQHAPVKVDDNHWVAVAGGLDHSLGLRADGSLYAWGNNSAGQLGIGLPWMIPASPYPTQVSPPTKWVAIAAGMGYSLGIQADGTLWAWGLNNDRGQLGLGVYYSNKYFPTPVGAAHDWIAVAASKDGGHSLALRGSGTLWSWGDNSDGQLGLGYSLGSVNIPTQIGTFGNWTGIACGEYHSMAVASLIGWFYTWGANNLGQLGLGNQDPKNAPTLCSWAVKKKQIPAGGFGHTMFFYNNGTLFGTGYNSYGQLGINDPNNASRLSPTSVTSATDWVAVAAGHDHTLGLKSDGTLWAWGRNDSGQLGLNNTDPTEITPFKVSGSFLTSVSLSLPPLELLLLN